MEDSLWAPPSSPVAATVQQNPIALELAVSTTPKRRPRGRPRLPESVKLQRKQAKAAQGTSVISACVISTKPKTPKQTTILLSGSSTSSSSSASEATEAKRAIVVTNKNKKTKTRKIATDVTLPEMRLLTKEELVQFNTQKRFLRTYPHVAACIIKLLEGDHLTSVRLYTLFTKKKNQDNDVQFRTTKTVATTASSCFHDPQVAFMQNNRIVRTTLQRLEQLISMVQSPTFEKLLCH
jgi:hypothetical protein